MAQERREGVERAEDPTPPSAPPSESAGEGGFITDACERSFVDELARFAKLVSDKLSGRVLLVSVFGSRVRGGAGPLSDVDVAVLPASWSSEEKLLLACDLAALASESFGVPEDRVDIAFLDEDPPPWLLFEALVRGRVVYSADRDLQASLRLRAVSEYLDFEVFKRKLNLVERYLEAVKRGVADG